MRYDYMYMLERFEIIAGYHGLQKPCFGCGKLDQEMKAAGRYDAHFIEPNKSKLIFLTIVNYKRNSLGEKITPEFYCHSCANRKWKEIGTKLINFSVSEANTSALIRAPQEWEYHWKESEEEKKLKPNEEIWQKK